MAAAAVVRLEEVETEAETAVTGEEEAGWGALAGWGVAMAEPCNGQSRPSSHP